jgi:hypothetical protein
LDALSLSETDIKIDTDASQVMLLDILYAYHYELRLLEFKEEFSSESA